MKSWIIATTLGLVLGAASANAATITDNFSFLDGSNTVIANGSFSYSSAATGTIGFSDLSAFTFNAFGQAYDLAFVNGIPTDPSFQNYVYFGYDVTEHQFVPAPIDGYFGPTSAILAATDGFTGFFVSPLPGQADPAGTGSDGQIAVYTTVNDVTDVSLVNAKTLVQSIPEPSTWVLTILGFVVLAAVAHRRKYSPKLSVGWR
ncbi:PEP-CTERM sorting domain-containing protein [Bradyrhizobium lablabi]|uniref:PEP-CTERM sorting domain-containing protein n=1 Tax=Bradyrhizobium lablabi TaxID=722472 RepID=UPI001BAD502B|nr:PEP-CTERM sorting domain-containing protein [Bradyrhizobium lablabi]MBR0697797.1 PEP-CTERM sorting domain-containing protein [Bradyrhizobium lablabi]